ncbi:OLC1v1035221C1 [Oldenlandia corymbosa var. corymbosa]|uniref:OLC1v1035221C1 n=1 Tax=Oldenlandia corymbosa var. corymbosa TaxID=529605 RepID=A0AAV1CVQ2_OLDCO|nr:OLC1v1035221C1 [Oldenlandia corymbosa var. corymbosa]
MAGKPKVMARIGYIEVVPSSSSKAVVKSSGGKRGWTDSSESQKTTKAVCRNTAGGGCSAKFTKTEKAGGFVDKRSGNQGYKQEVSYKSSVKVNDKARGCTTEYETQVKFKKTTTYTAPKKSAAAAAAAPKAKSSGSGYKNVAGAAPKAKSSGSGYKSVAYYGHHYYGY